MPEGAGPQASTALPLQTIQRRLEEIEVTFRELEQQGIKLEKLLRDEDSKARVDRDEDGKTTVTPMAGDGGGLCPAHHPPSIVPQAPRPTRKRSG